MFNERIETVTKQIGNPYTLSMSELIIPTPPQCSGNANGNGEPVVCHRTHVSAADDGTIHVISLAQFMPAPGT